jgi:hypothetical protein
MQFKAEALGSPAAVLRLQTKSVCAGVVERRADQSVTGSAVARHAGPHATRYSTATEIFVSKG